MTERQMIDAFVSWARCSEKCAIDYLKLHEWNYQAATADYWRTNIAIY